MGRFAAHRNHAFVNHGYIDRWDSDSGPSFIQFRSHARFAMRVWLHGPEWAIRQLAGTGIRFEPVDNGIAWVEDLAAPRRICDRLSAPHRQRSVDRWLHTGQVEGQARAEGSPVPMMNIPPATAVRG